LVVSFAGFLDSAYLTLKHYLAFQVPCSITHGCEEVLGSSYADIFGIPVALLGVLYYLAVFVSMVAFLDKGRFVFLKAVIAFPFVGFFFTIWFVFVQAVVLQAFCLYCLLSAGLTSALFALSVYYLFYGYRKSIG
jgi:uncharacterized membrane protein